MVNIPEIWSKYQKYGQSTRNMVNIPEIWSTYQKYGQHTRNIVTIPEVQLTYQKYGQHTRNLVNIPEIWSTYQKYSLYTRNMVKIPEAWSTYQHTRNMVNIPEIQLSKSSRALNGGAYFSDVSGWKSILTSATEAYDHTESYRLLGFYLTITFCLKPTQQAVSLWNCRVCWRICLFYLYGFVTAGKYLWSSRREILQQTRQFQ